MGMPDLVWWRAFLGIGTLRSNTISIKRNVNIRTGYVTWFRRESRPVTLIAMNARNALVDGI